MQKKVLIIDDSKSSRREIARQVQLLGLMAFEAENGRYGLEMARNRTDIGIVFCDLNMPEVNGLEFLAAFRKEAGHASTPVVMMSSEANEEVRKQAQAFKIEGWLLKPQPGEEVKKMLQKFCA